MTARRPPIDDLERETLGLRAAGRHALGVTGRFELGPMSEAFAASDLSWFPLLAVSALGAADALFAIGAISTAGPMSTSLGIPNLSLLVYLRLAGLAAAGLATLGVLRGAVSRSAVGVTGAAIAIAALLTTSRVRNAWALAAAALLAGLASGVAATIHRPLLFDHYRPEVRVRVLSAYAAGIMVAAALASMALPAADALGLSWRSAFVGLAVLAFVAVLPATRLRDPIGATWEGRVISGLVEHQLGPRGDASPTSELDTTLTAAQRLRQVLATPAAPPLLFAASAFGLFTVTLPPYLLTFWRDHWRVGQDGQLALFAGLSVASLAGLWWFARRGELMFRAGPARMLRMVGRATCLGAVALPLATIGWFPAMAMCLAVAFATLAMLLPATSVALLAVVRPSSRAHASLALGIAVLWGALFGNFLMQAFAKRYGLRWAFLVAALDALGAAVAATRAARAIDDAVNATVGALLEEEELRTRASQGQHLPLLAVRHVEFSYGPVQVLFDVNFTVDDGEMVALLGTNGAGKSTLLRLVSGISLPSGGSVRFRGSDITHIGPDERVRLGISQVPGGRAIFGPMTVAENLRVFGHAHGRDRRSIEAGIEASFAAFPNLAARADNPAATLSGGEQQMLAISKAFVVRPRILLIDELSLGLAPIVVGELLSTVRRLNAEGMAVVIVEQSVNIALSLVDHAYFMEKGEIGFDGPADDLADRPDLLRSVFLDGAAARLAR